MIKLRGDIWLLNQLSIFLNVSTKVGRTEPLQPGSEDLIAHLKISQSHLLFRVDHLALKLGKGFLELHVGSSLVSAHLK